MRSSVGRILTAAIFCAMFAAPAAASLITVDFAAPGDQLLTRDTETGLEWLDVTETVGQSRQAVLAGDFVTAHGFRYATREEVLDLWLHAGASGPFLVGTGDTMVAGNYDAAITLIDLMGCTSHLGGLGTELCDGIDQNWHIAYFATDAAIVDYFGPPDSRAGTAAMWIDLEAHLDLPSRPDVGSYLVRQWVATVPEPATLSLVAGGLVALCLARRRRGDGAGTA